MASIYEDDGEFVAPLDSSEVAALIAAGPRPLQRDGKKLMLLLRRMQSSLETHKRQSLAYERHLTELANAQRQAGGRPTTLNPLDAARFLDDSQKEMLFDSFSREQLQRLRHLIQQGQEERAVVAAQLSMVRKAGAALMGLPQLPHAMRAEIAALLGSLPLEAANVSVPGMLELPDRDDEPEPPVPKRDTGSGEREGPASSSGGVNRGGSEQAPPVYVDPYAAVTVRQGAYQNPYAPGR